jgi:heptosyltransferase-2
MRPKRILIIRTDRIGDVALSTPVIKAIRETYPDSYIAFMVRPYAREIVDGNPYLNEVIVYDKYRLHKGFFSTLLFGLRMRKKNFDIAIILHPTNRAHIIVFIAGIPNRIGLDRKLKFLLTKKLNDEKFLGQKHELEYTLDILEKIGIEVRDKSMFVPVKEVNKKSIDSKLSQKNIESADTLIAIHPGASCPSKKWPLEYFASLVYRLTANYGVQIVLLGGPEEVDETSKLKFALTGNIIDMSGQTSVGELAALLKRCKLFISNDSGPVHIATAVGTPSIVIFGRKQPGLSPKRWGPRGREDIVLHKDVGCKVCFAHNCKNDFKCLKAITVDEVFCAVKKLAAGRLQTKVEPITKNVKQ